MTFFIVLGLVVVAALLLGHRYDQKHRRLGDSSTGGATGGRARGTKLDSQEKSTRWGAGGA